jgi:osmotically-inducible protein OsmY
MTSLSSRIADDAHLRQLVLEALARAAPTAVTAEISGETLDVVVSHGWVILGGAVDVPFQRQEAERVVHHLPGVQGVINRIGVRAATPTSKDVRGRIERALIRNAGTDAERIRIQVCGDKVVLQGTVRSNAERRAVEGAAQTAPGITKVESYLVVTSPI